MIQPYLFGEYLLLDRISVGGMAEVFCARKVNSITQEYVAIKRLLPHLAQDRRTTAMFAHEAQLASFMEHQGVVACTDYGQVGVDHFITLDYVHGPDCQAILRAIARNADPLPIDIIAYLFERIARALDYIHRLVDDQGFPLDIVHMDVTPENILVSYDGQVRLTDFGISTSRLSPGSAQNQGMKGKTAYISPEQAQGLQPDARSDLYSLAVIIFEFVAGRPLHDGQNHFVIFDQVQSGLLPALQEALVHLPSDFGQLLTQSLAQDPTERYQCASDLADALHSFRSHLSDADAHDALSQWFRINFVDAIAYQERAQERFERFEVLSDGQVVEHAPSTEDATSMWDFSPGDEDGEPPTAAMRVFEPMEVSLLGGRLDGTPPPDLSDAAQPAIVIPDSRPVDPSSVPPEASPITSSTTHDVSHAFTPVSGTHLGDQQNDRRARLKILSWSIVLASAILGAWAARTVVPESNGHLVIHASPLNARIALDDEGLVADRSPAVFNDLPTGWQEVSVSAAGHTSGRVRVEVKPGRLSFAHITLNREIPESTNLKFEIVPENAELIIDGVSKGRQRMIEVSSDQRVVMKVQATGFQSQERVLLPRGDKERRVHFALMPLAATVLLKTTPEKVTLQVNDRRWDVTTPYALKGLPRTEDVVVTISSAGYETVKHRLALHPDQAEYTADIELTKRHSPRRTR